MLMGQGRGVTPADLLKPLKDSWPTYNGDYSGKRYSALTQINQSTVKNLTLAWMTRVTPGPAMRAAAAGEAAAAAGRRRNIIVGGEGTGDFAAGGGSIKASVLQVDGTLYFTMPDNAWAVDARDGRELWHYFWKTKGGTHIGNRGLAMWNNYLYMETPDDYLVSLDAKTGKERWHKEIADLSQGYFSTPAPDRRRQSRAGGHGQRYRCAGLPAVVRSRDRRTAMEALHRADEEGRSRIGDVGHAWMRRGTAAPKPGSRAPTIPRPSCTSSAPAIRRRPTRRAPAATATTCSPARWSR